MMRRFTPCLLLVALACAAQAAEDLQPAVDTSATERAAATARPAAAAAGSAAAAAAAKPGVAPAPVAARQPATPAAPASSAAAAGAAGSSGSRTGGSARDRVELENTQITGNRELPKVMYVVPWKKPDLGEFGGRPAKSLLDELLEPVDRDVFKRQNRYFEALQPDAAQPRSGDEK